jgi:hypothetical protein
VVRRELQRLGPERRARLSGPADLVDEFASVYCRFTVSNKYVRASLTLLNGTGNDLVADTIAIAEAR